MEKCKICGSYPIVRETEEASKRYYATCSCGGRRLSEGECCYGPECETREEAEAAWDELMRAQPEPAAVRRPVAAMIGPETSSWQSRLVVICDDGSIWIDGSREWLMDRPIPGTLADMARAKCVG